MDEDSSKEWFVSKVRIGDSCGEVLQKRGEATLATRIRERLAALHYHLENDTRTISAYFDIGLNSETVPDPGAETVSSVMGLELQGPRGCFLSIEDHTLKVIEHLGQPDAIEGPLSDGSSIWTFEKGQVRIDVYLKDGQIEVFHLLDSKLT